MTGLRRKTWPASRLGSGLITIMMIGTTFAADNGDMQPSLEMLEFLVEFDAGDGQWHDPAELDPQLWQEIDPLQESESTADVSQESGS